MQVYKVTTGT